MPKESLKNKIIFITGASLGFGRLMALNFAKSGCKLALTYYKDEKEANEVKENCMELGASEVLMLKLDVKDSKNISKVVSEVIKKFNSVDVLINNAGIVVWKKLNEQNEEEIDKQIQTNLTGLIKMSKACVPYVKEMVLNFGSAAGLNGYEDLAIYCATKFGVRGFTQALAQENPKIKVYVVNPGAYATRMNDFQGRPPEEVADLVLNIVNEKYKIDSGSDINVWEYVK